MKNIFNPSRPEEKEYFQLDNENLIDCSVYLNMKPQKRLRVGSLSRSNSPIRLNIYEPSKII